MLRLNLDGTISSFPVEAVRRARRWSGAGLRWLAYSVVAVDGLLLLAFAVGAFLYLRPKKIALPVSLPGPEIRMAADDCCRISIPGRTLTGELAEFDDGLFAYLMFDHYRSQPDLAERQMMLVSREQKGEQQDSPNARYRIIVQLPDDLREGLAILAQLKMDRLTSQLTYKWATAQEMTQDRLQTRLFTEAYSGPGPETLERLHGHELQAYLRRFIRFKSYVDPRTHSNLDTVPSPLTQQQAGQLAADMIAVSKFYDIPLTLLIGIGAMENNYMNVPGDLANTAWKRFAEPGDIVLARRRHRVQVINSSSGVWQITRQTLRHAQRLYLADKRDYSQLPERLRPPKKLNIDRVEPEVLTTYAGLLLRDLLDKFHGDVTLAAGAYNGTYEHPNPTYAAGVEAVADYARRILNGAAELNFGAGEQAEVDSKVVRRP